MNKRIVIALGGNALGDTNQEQIAAIKTASCYIIDLVEKGHQVVIVHGNGPQVGKINMAFELSGKLDGSIEKMPLPESVAMSQGYIGYHLQNQLLNLMEGKNLNKDVFTILTQVLVSVEDPSFSNPSKPIGPFYTIEEIKEKGYEHYIEDSGRGYRKVVASPKPLKIIEAEGIKTGLDAGHVVVCAGGGGIPVVKDGQNYISVDAVVDKDASASLLAQEIDADMLVILTAVDQVAINFGKPEEKWLSEISLEELDIYMKEGHFAPGSMLPKVEACHSFIAQNKNAYAIITSLEKLSDAINGQGGTIINY